MEITFHNDHLSFRALAKACSPGHEHTGARMNTQWIWTKTEVIFSSLFTTLLASFLPSLKFWEKCRSAYYRNHIHPLPCFAQRNRAYVTTEWLFTSRFHLKVKGSLNPYWLTPQLPRPSKCRLAAVFPFRDLEFPGPGTKHIYFQWINTVTQWTDSSADWGVRLALSLAASVWRGTFVSGDQE